mgnify:CR=1 FL=1
MKDAANPHWIKHSHLLSPDEYECSACGGVFRRKSRTCPKCGAVLIRVADRHEWIDEAAMLDEILGDD